MNRSRTSLGLAFLAAAAACAGARVRAEEPEAPAPELSQGKIEKPPCESVKSPNFNAAERKKGDIHFVVIHTIEGTAAGCVKYFETKESKVSAHYVIAKDGKITQMVADKDIAWHAGNGKYNKEAIGIEHEGFAGKNLWTEAQMRASASLTRWLCATYEIPVDRKHLIGHCEVPDPNDPTKFGGAHHHSDPGKFFDWDLYQHLIKDPSFKVDLGAKKESEKPAEKQAEPAPVEPKKAD